MTTAEVDAVVREAMALVLEVEVPATGDLTRAATPAWDSLKHVELVVTVEDACQVDLGECGLGELDSLSGIVQAVRAGSAGSDGSDPTDPRP